MDASKQYILMCRTAQEIQECWEPKHGDHYFGTPSGHSLNDERFYEVCIALDGDSEGLHFHIEPWYIQQNKKEFIFLPRQDQLQEMVIKNNTIPKYIELQYRFNKFIIDMDGYNQHSMPKMPVDSLEQLWLSFAMYELYNKIFDGKEWRKK